MKKTTLLLVTALFYLGLLHAQTAENKNKTPLTNEEFFTKSDLVFEGGYAGVVASYDTKGYRNFDDIYSIIAYKVDRVYKGDASLAGNTIYVVGRSDEAGIRHFERNNPIVFDEDSNIEEITFYGPIDFLYSINPFIEENCTQGDYGRRIFFFTTSADEYPKEDVAAQKYALHQKYKHLQGLMTYGGGTDEGVLYVCGNKILGLDSLIFYSRNEFFDYMKQFKKYGFTDIDYYKYAEQYYQEKRKEADEYIKTAPKPDTLHTLTATEIYTKFLQQQRDWKKKRPGITEFTDYGKIQALQKELNDVENLVQSHLNDLNEKTKKEQRIKDQEYRQIRDSILLEIFEQQKSLRDSMRNEWREQYRREQYRLQDSLQNTTPEHKKKALTRPKKSREEYNTLLLEVANQELIYDYAK